MKKFLSITLLSVFISQCMMAGKIEKKVTVGRATDCKGIAFNCTASNSTSITVQYAFNEDGMKGLAMQILEADAMQLPDLIAALKNMTQIRIEEDIVLPSDISYSLGIPFTRTISKGLYQVVCRNGVYMIMFQKQ